MPISIDYVRQHINDHFDSVYEKKESEDNAAFILPFSGYTVVLRVSNDRHFLSGRIINIMKIEEKNKDAVLEKAMNINYSLILGKFSLDSSDGEFCFQASVVSG